MENLFLDNFETLKRLDLLKLNIKEINSRNLGYQYEKKNYRLY
jgi:hypothetical protein